MPSQSRDTPRAVATRLESSLRPTEGAAEWLEGYGVTGVTFASGHVLVLRRFAASSIGPPFTSVWHRDPRGDWTLHADLEPELAWARYFGAAAVRSVRDEVTLAWLGTHSLSVQVLHARLAWAVHLAPTIGTRVLSALAPRIPAAAWRSRLATRVIAGLGGRSLGVGRATLEGRSPNGLRYAIRPRRLWSVDASVGRIHGRHLGPLVLPRAQARLGDVWLPRWGLFVVGQESVLPDPTGGPAEVAPGAAAPAGGGSADADGPSDRGSA
jgi:hypothetical protein